MSSLSPVSTRETSRPTSRSARRDDNSPKPSKSRTRQFLSSVSRSRSRPGTPDLTSGLEDLPRRSQSQDAVPTLDKSPLMTPDVLVRPLTRESQYQPSEWRQDRPPNLARSLLHKSSRLLNKRRSSNKLRSPEPDDGESFSEFRDAQLSTSKSKQGRGTPQPAELLKQSISDPFNFQHLTHTSPTEAKSLQSASSHNLATEFQAIHSTQSPGAELKGIIAEDIHKQSEPFPPVASPSMDHDSPTTSQAASRTTSRPTTRPSSPGEATNVNESNLRSSKSADSFTRGPSRSFSSPMPPISPPPRKSSRRPLPLANIGAFNAQSAIESPILPQFRQDSTASSKTQPSHPVMPSPKLALDTEQPRSPQIAQAVTTPDDSACMLHSKSPSTPLPQLEDVPEEEEAGGKSENSDAKLIRHIKSFPSARHFSRVFPPGTHVEAASSEPALPAEQAPTGAREVPHGLHRVLSRRVSNGKAIMVESWEDGVDFCYDHAMDEIDELYDWDPEQIVEEALRAGGSDESTPQGNTADEDPYSSIPDLQAESTKSAASSSVTVPGIVTPAEPSAPSPQILTVPRDANGGTAFTLSPSLLIPKEYSSSTRMTHEDQSYHYALPSSAESSKNSYFYSGLGIETDMPRNYSPRSSGGTRLSKQTSHESLSISRSGSGSTRKTAHRQSSSVGSVPELIGGKDAFVGLGKETRGRTPQGLNVDALRQDFIKAADLVPHSTLEAATPPPGTPVKMTFPKSVLSGAPRSRSNSDSASRLLNALPTTSGAPTPTLTPKPDKGHGGIRPLEAIGAMKPPRHGHRLRSSSVANLTQMKPRGQNHRMSYSLFPNPPGYPQIGK